MYTASGQAYYGFMRKRPLPASPWRYVWSMGGMLLCQIPAMVLGAVFGVLFSIIWITIISVCFLALTGIWIWQTYELHGLLLASEQRVAEAEQAFRKDMTEAGAPVSLIDQIVAHLDDDDLTGANLVLTKFLGGTP